MLYLGDFTTSETIYIPLMSYDNVGASVTLTGLAVADVKIYKDGSTTERSSTAGIALLDTDGIDFDSVTGLHGISVDLSDDTDTDFYEAGSQYWLIIDSVTIDGETVRVGYYFTIGRMVRATVDGNTLDITSTGAVGVDWGNVENKTTTHDFTNTTVGTITTYTGNTKQTADVNTLITTVGTAGAGLTAVAGNNGPTALYVDPVNGASGNDGTTWALAKDTIANAVSVAAAGDTIYLSGGTHTVTTGTQIDLPDGVNLVGESSTSTIVTGDPGGVTDGVLEVAGKNTIERMRIIDLQGVCIKVNTTAASDLVIKDCYLSAQTDVVSVYDPASGRTQVTVTDSVIDVQTWDGLSIVAAACDLIVRRTQFIGVEKGIYCATSTSDITILLHDCNFTAMTAGSSDRLVDVSSSGTGSIKMAVFNTQWATVDGIALYANASGAGTVEIEDLGNTNLAESTTSINGTAALVYTSPSADTALSDINLDHLMAVADSDDVANDSVIAQLTSTSGDWSTFSKTTDSLESIKILGDANWTTALQGPATAIYVDTVGGSDSNDGSSWAKAFATILYANTVATAGDTIYLSGGTHVIATGTTITLATGVHIIGSGTTTIVSGDPEPSSIALFTLSGNNHIGNMTLNSQERCVAINSTSASDPCSISGCYLTAVVGLVYLNGPTTGRHSLEIKDTVFDISTTTGLSIGNAAAAVVIRNCQFRGGARCVYAAQTTNDLILLLDDCEHAGVAMTTSDKSISLTSTGTGDIQCGIRNTQWAIGDGISIEVDASSTGEVVVQEMGGNNLLETAYEINGTAKIRHVSDNIRYRGTTTATGTTTTLKASGISSSVTDMYKGDLLRLTSATYDRQIRFITAYDSSTKTITFEPAVATLVATGVTFDILEGTGINPDGIKLNATQDTATWALNLATSAGIMYTGTATGGTVTTLIDTLLTAADDIYNNRIVYFLTGTLAGQVASISDYDLSTKTITISQVTTSPTNETYIII